MTVDFPAPGLPVISMIITASITKSCRRALMLYKMVHFLYSRWMAKAIIFDIDGTLTDTVSWLKITEILGASVDEHSRIFADFTDEKITYTDSKQQLMTLWQSTGNANRHFMTKAFRDWDFSEGAEKLVQACSDKGYTVAIITGSVDLFAQAVADHFGIAHYYANTELVWDERGNLIDFHYTKDQSTKKLEQLHEFGKTTGIPTSACIVAGDSDNDIKLFTATSKGIAVNSDDADLLEVAWKSVDNLAQVEKFI